MPEEGINSLAEAFASAESEVGLAESAVEATTLPAVGSEDVSVANTPSEEVDQPDEEQGAEFDLDGFKELFVSDEGAEQQVIEPGSPEFLELPVTVDTVAGEQTITIGEATKGYMRQADYTQKTQELAAQRQALSDAVELWNSFREDPDAFARTIAVRAGLIEEGAQPVKDIKAAEIPTPETIEQMVEQRVQERIANDPAVRDAKLVQARNAVANVFSGIEQKFNVQLDQASREAVIREANQRGTTDIELVFEAMLSRVRSQQPKRPGAARPTGTPVAAEQASQEQLPATLAEAFALAEAELAGV